VDRCTLDRNSI